MEEKVVNQEVKEQEPVPVYSYTVTRYSNRSYDIVGNALDPEKPEELSIDMYHAAMDIIDLGRELHDKKVMDTAVQKAVNIVFSEINKLANEAQPEEDPTRA